MKQGADPRGSTEQLDARPAPGVPHVLVVDDDPGIRGFIQMALQAEDYSVATAANGQQALDRIAERRPDALLVDLAMPIMNGWELLARLRELQANIPFIFMTAGFNAQVEAEKHNADGYLAKPFEVDDLLATVARFAPLHYD